MISRRDFLGIVGAAILAPSLPGTASRPVHFKQLIYVIDAIMHDKAVYACDDGPDKDTLLLNIEFPSYNPAIQFKTFDSCGVVPGDLIDIEQDGVKNEYRVFRVSEVPYDNQT